MPVDPHELSEAVAFVHDHRQQVHEIASHGDGSAWSAWPLPEGATAPTLADCIIATARALGWEPKPRPPVETYTRAEVLAFGERVADAADRTREDERGRKWLPALLDALDAIDAEKRR